MEMCMATARCQSDFGLAVTKHMHDALDDNDGQLDNGRAPAALCGPDTRWWPEVVPVPTSWSVLERHRSEVLASARGGDDDACAGATPLKPLPAMYRLTGSAESEARPAYSRLSSGPHWIAGCPTSSATRPHSAVGMGLPPGRGHGGRLFWTSRAGLQLALHGRLYLQSCNRHHNSDVSEPRSAITMQRPCTRVSAGLPWKRPTPRPRTGSAS